jgi:hypothetical protein
MPTRFVTRGLLMSLLALCAACSGGGLNSATGKVSYKGNPIKGAIVIFHPKAADVNSQRPSGVTDEAGAYSLMTGTKAGAPAGDYVVTITWPGEVQAKAKSGKGIGTNIEAPEAPDQLNGRYADSTRSTLTATIKGGSNTIPTFELK